MTKAIGSRRWSLTAQSVNCGSYRCKKGCYNSEIGEKTKKRPHGPYYTMTRRRTDSDTVATHEKFRIGTFRPRKSDIAAINAVLGQPIAAAVWNDPDSRRSLVSQLRHEVSLLMTGRGYPEDDAAAIAGARYGI